MTLTIVADDLTGACDTGTVFAGKAPVPVTIWPRPPYDAPVRVVDTESRPLPAAEARRRVASAARAAPAARYFKKVDSTLRGRVGPEIEALLDASGAPTALLCPAFPAQRRTLVGGVLTVDGVPLADTPLARDAAFPHRAGGSSRVTDLLRTQVSRPLDWIPLDEVRGGTAALGARLGRAAGAVIVADAETDADLDALVDAALALDAGPLLAGAAGLARALAARLGVLAEHAALPPRGRWLVVAGSRHPATARQVAEARRAGMCVIATSGHEPGHGRDVATRLAARAHAKLAAERFDVVAVTGGATAVALVTALEADRIDLLGAPAAGVALGRLERAGHPPLVLLTKAGGFGDPELFVALARGAEP